MVIVEEAPVNHELHNPLPLTALQEPRAPLRRVRQHRQPPGTGRGAPWNPFKNKQ